MSDPVDPRQVRGWPLAAITFLVLLLAGFLFLKWRKRDDGPVVVKEPPVAVRSEDPKPPEPEAFEEKKQVDTEEAEAALRKEEEARAEEVRKAELRKRQEKEFDLLKEKVGKIRAQDFWDEALQTLEQFSREFPGANQDEEFVRMERQIREFRGEAENLFVKAMGDGQKQFADGNYVQAIAQAEGALKYFPERKPVVREFQDRARLLQFEKGMVRVPGAMCWIGDDTHPDEKPLRQIKLEPFYIDKYEVTNEEYLAFVSATSRPEPPHWQGRRIAKGRERHPVSFVAWEDAQAYATWAGKRLPTAEEWEVSARGPDRREYPWGNAFEEKANIFFANCLEHWQVNKAQSPGTLAVDAPALANGESAFGVYGMGGNVWEWTATAVPRKGGKEGPEFRILKGGSFMTPRGAVRCANVYAEDPRLGHPDVGFRCARDVR